MLINGLIGEEVAKVGEGFKTKGTTTEVQSYTKKIDDIEVVAYDSPGLEDGSSNEKQYLDEIYQICRQGVHLVIFAISMRDNRFAANNPNVHAMKKFTKKLTPAIWENTLVVLTQANLCEALNPNLRRKSKEDKGTFFKEVVSGYKAAIHQTLKTTCRVPAAIVEKVKVVPVGIEFEEELLDDTLWFSNFWFESLAAIPTPEGQAAMTIINRRRFIERKHAAEKDFKQPLHNQPIVFLRTFFREGTTMRTVYGLRTALAIIKRRMRIGHTSQAALILGIFLGTLAKKLKRV